jgi:hypothetical protein
MDYFTFVGTEHVPKHWQSVHHAIRCTGEKTLSLAAAWTAA